MADYTTVNLREIKDVAPDFGLSPGLQARYARKPLELAQSGVTLYRLAPDFRAPFGHRHDDQEEIYVVVSGSARIKIEDEIVELGEWDAIRVAPKAMRCLEGGPDGAEVMAYGSPTDDNRDAQLEQGWWSD